MLKINDTRKVADLIVAELNKRGAGLGNAAAFCVMQTLDELEAAQQRMHTDPPSALRPQSSTGKLSSPMVEIISQDLAGG